VTFHSSEIEGIVAAIRCNLSESLCFDRLGLRHMHNIIVRLREPGQRTFVPGGSIV
jgi:hypothetical protein